MADENAGAVEADNPAADQTEETTQPEGGDQKEGGSLLENPGEGKDAPADFPEDWRDRMAGGDESFRKRLDRFKSPTDVANSYRELEKKLSSGQKPDKLPADATEEDVAAFRKAHGIPETAEGYFSDLGGLVIGDDDKPGATSFAEALHAQNAPPEVVKAALEWYTQNKDAAATEQSEADKKMQTEAADALRDEWGPEYRANFNAAMNFLEAAPAISDDMSMKDAILGARLADGTLFGNNPGAIKWLVNLANEANPAGFVSPGQGGSQAQSVADEIAEIEGVMRTDRQRYNKDTKMQERLRQLYAAEEKLSARG